MNSSDQDMKLHTEERGTYFLLKPSGALSAHHVVEFRKAVEQAMAMEHTRLAVDLSEINYMDSTGLGLLINITKNLARKSGSFILFNPSQVAANLFQATNTNTVLHISHRVDNPDLLFD